MVFAGFIIFFWFQLSVTVVCSFSFINVSTINANYTNYTNLCNISNISSANFSDLPPLVASHISRPTVSQRKKTAYELSWGILTSIHTITLAKSVATELRTLPNTYSVDVWTSSQETYVLDRYIIIAGNDFLFQLPPLNQTYIYQLEQHGSNWFTDRYREVLSNCLGVLEYNQDNFQPLIQKGVYNPSQTHLWYLPAAVKVNPLPLLHGKQWHVLFYGSMNDRRAAFVNALNNQPFVYQFVEGVFGEDMLTVAKHAYIVVNIHFYETAILEVPRIVECLSIGVPVVSEWTADAKNFPQLARGVRYFDLNSIDSMLNVIMETLTHMIPESDIYAAAEETYNVFSTHFRRMLFATGVLNSTHLNTQTYGPSVNLSSYDRVLLTFPERHHPSHTTEKTKMPIAHVPGNAYSFPCIQYTSIHCGCSLTHKYLAQAALQAKKKQYTILEEGAILPKRYKRIKTIINAYLHSKTTLWDIFSGVTASFTPDMKILQVDTFNNVTFITINQVTSTVYNIYNQNALRILAAHDSPSTTTTTGTTTTTTTTSTYTNRGSVTYEGTINNVFNTKNIRVVITYPNYFTHRDHRYSNTTHTTLHNYDNTILKNKLIDYFISHKRKLT